MNAAILFLSAVPLSNAIRASLHFAYYGKCLGRIVGPEITTLKMIKAIQSMGKEARKTQELC
jgi:hypothetical protein